MNKLGGASVRSLSFTSLLFFLFFPLTLILPLGPASGQAVDLEKGRRLYLSTCLQCHNRNPNLKGSLGPELVDAPLEVMVSKITTGKYPEKLPAGFIPKRKTTMMRKLLVAEKDIPSIHAWIQSLKGKNP